jgi:RNase adaptor protein for sRNA GlmZ degradation
MKGGAKDKVWNVRDDVDEELRRLFDLDDAVTDYIEKLDERIEQGEQMHPFLSYWLDELRRLKR